MLEWFWMLSARRSSGGMGLSPISWQDLDAWQRATGVRLRSFELDWLGTLDRHFLEATRPEAGGQVPRAPAAPKPPRGRR